MVWVLGRGVGRSLVTLAGLIGLLVSSSTAYSQGLPSREEMWRTIQQQQRQLEALQSKGRGTERKVEENTKAVEAAVEAAETSAGTGWWNRTSLGGYGELHYNNGVRGDRDQMDFHRYVLFVGHEFSDDMRLMTEFELEHSLAGDGKPGEVELEQAYVEFDFNKNSNGRAGIFLIPVGILNETHEPPTFYGVERNFVEKNIIPTTWWEGGAGLTFTSAAGIRVDGALHGGLEVPVTGSSAFKPRSGRQKVANSDLESPAITGRFRYTGIAGVEFAHTLQYQFDATQGTGAKTEAFLWEAHTDIVRPIGNGVTGGLRALYAKWDFDSDDAEAIGRDEQYGWYIEPSVKFDISGQQSLGMFARYAEIDNNAGTGDDTKQNQWTLGFNFWPHPNVVFKFDYQSLAAGSDETDHRFNLGVGYQF